MEARHPNVFQEIRVKKPLKELLKEYLGESIKSGVYDKYKCIFCNDSSQSLTFNNKMDIFYCFNCHKSGDTVTFMALHNKSSLNDGAKFLVDKYKLDIKNKIEEE